MQILECCDLDRVSRHRADSASGGIGGGKSSDAGDVVADRGASNGFFVVKGFAAQRRVDDQIHFARFDKVHDVGAAFVYFVNGFDLEPGFLECGGGAARGDNLEASRQQVFGEAGNFTLVAVIDADENGAFHWESLSRGELSFREGETEGGGDAHHFPGGAHFRAKNRIHAAEFIERE